jgi:hypothetical protein
MLEEAWQLSWWQASISKPEEAWQLSWWQASISKLASCAAH